MYVYVLYIYIYYNIYIYIYIYIYIFKCLVPQSFHFWENNPSKKIAVMLSLSFPICLQFILHFKVENIWRDLAGQWIYQIALKSIVKYFINTHLWPHYISITAMCVAWQLLKNNLALILRNIPDSIQNLDHVDHRKNLFPFFVLFFCLFLFYVSICFWKSCISK